MATPLLDQAMGDPVGILMPSLPARAERRRQQKQQAAKPDRQRIAELEELVMTLAARVEGLTEALLVARRDFTDQKLMMISMHQDAMQRIESGR